MTIHRPDTSDPDLFEEFVLHPGDAVYLPPGTWHRARATDGYSFAVTLAQARVSGFDILLTCLIQKVQEAPSLGQRVHGMPAGDVGAAGELTGELEELLVKHRGEFNRLVQSISENDVRFAYRQLAQAGPAQTRMVTKTEMSGMLRSARAGALNAPR